MSYDPYAQKQNADGSWSTSNFQYYEGHNAPSNRPAPSSSSSSGLVPFQPNPNNPYSSDWGKPGEPLFGDLTGTAPWVYNPQKIYDEYHAQFSAPVNAAFDRRAAQLSAQRAGISGLIGQQRALAQQGHDIALRRIGLREQGNQYDIELARQQQGFVEEGWGIAQERYGADKAYLSKLRTFATRDYNRETAYLGQQEEFAARGRDNALAQIGLDFNRNTRLATSDATARGAITSAGFHDTIGEIGQQRDILTSKTQLDYDSTMANIANQRGALGSKYERELADLDKQGIDLDFDLRETELSVKDKRATLDNRLKQLDLLAQDFGLQREELANSLAKGLAALGLQEKQALVGITDALASNEIQRQQAAMGIVIAAKQAADADMAAGRRN